MEVGGRSALIRMGDSTDLFEDLRERTYEEKAGKASRGSAVEPVGAAEPAAPSAPLAPPAHDDHVDLEAPLLEEQPSGQAIQEHEQPPPVLEPAPSPPQSDPLLYVCRVLSIVTAVGALLCLVVNAISLFRAFDYRGFDYRVSVRFGDFLLFSFLCACFLPSSVAIMVFGRD